MTPHSLAFYLDVITSGTVLGAKPTDSPDQVAWHRARYGRQDGGR
ncbi:hypothetical protein ACFYW9_09550 [Streptomyces sp. NPDC002698]